MFDIEFTVVLFCDLPHYTTFPIYIIYNKISPYYLSTKQLKNS